MRKGSTTSSSTLVANDLRIFCQQTSWDLMASVSLVSVSMLNNNNNSSRSNLPTLKEWKKNPSLSGSLPK